MLFWIECVSANQKIFINCIYELDSTARGSLKYFWLPKWDEKNCILSCSFAKGMSLGCTLPLASGRGASTGPQGLPYQLRSWGTFLLLHQSQHPRGRKRTPGLRRIGLGVSYISCFAKGPFLWILHLFFCLSASSFSSTSLLWPSFPVLRVMGNIARPSSVDTERGVVGLRRTTDNTWVDHKQWQEARIPPQLCH